MLGTAENPNHVASVNAMWDGELEVALDLAAKALAREPNNARFRWQRAVTLLQAGRWAEGWAEFEWRTERFSDGYKPIPGERWMGDPLNGRRLLVHTEQGFGDTIMWARYLPWLAKQNGPATIASHDEIGSLLRAWAPENVKVVWPAMGGQVEYDVWCWMGSLPWLHGTRLHSIPPCHGANRGRGPIKKIGVCWAGAKGMPQDDRRSMDFADIEPLLARDEFEFYSFQYGDIPRERMTPLVPLGTDWLKTAGLLDGMDAVVAVDTGVAHLAASLGIETHLMLGDKPEWRWFPGLTWNPWYPSMSIHKQATGDWAPVIESVISSLCSTAGRGVSQLLGQPK